MNPLSSIPARARLALYWIGYLLGVVGQGITIVWGAVAASSPEVAMPLWLVITSAVLGLAQTQLNLLAGTNVTPDEQKQQVELKVTGGLLYGDQE